MRKKKYLKNDKLEQVLLYRFLNDKNLTQFVSHGKKKLLLCLYLCILEEKNLN